MPFPEYAGDGIKFYTGDDFRNWADGYRQQGLLMNNQRPVVFIRPAGALQGIVAFDHISRDVVASVRPAAEQRDISDGEVRSSPCIRNGQTYKVKCENNRKN